MDDQQRPAETGGKATEENSPCSTAAPQHQLQFIGPAWWPHQPQIVLFQPAGVRFR